jgi:putative membrane protein
MFMQWRNLYRGFLMGISDLIPGVSGRTIAFILGIYDELLAAISGFFSRNWKKHIGFLLPLGIGIGATLLLFSRVIEYLLKNHHAPTQFFFMGLVIGVLPFITKQAGVKRNFTWKHFIVILLVGAVLASLAFIKPQDTTVITSLTTSNAIWLFFAGWAGSMAMLLPGISGSLILLILGVYSTAIGALSNFNLPIIAVIGAGVIVGFIVSSKAISYLLKYFTYITFALIIGLIVGSVFVIYPGIPESGTPFVLSVIAFFTGLVVANMFSSSNKASMVNN